MKGRLVLTTLVVASLGLLAASFRAAPLPAPAPFGGPVPAASPPAEMSAVRIDTGVIHRNAGVAYRGGSLAEPRDFAMTAVLVRHPKGDLLIDTGLGRDLDRHLGLMPWAFRAVTRIARGVPAAAQLDRAGYDRGRLRGIVLTHAHWDHVSGADGFPGVPLLVPGVERGFVEGGSTLTAVARDLPGARWEEYGFESGPYLGFPASHDAHGDGSFVIVPSPGHTPGSVVVFVTLPAGRRLAFVGDLVWQLEGITEREERPFFTRMLADEDPAGVREGILRMAALHARFPELAIAPAHDGRGFAALPAL